MSKEKSKTAVSAKTTSDSSSKGGYAIGGQDKASFAFGKNNYKMMGIGIALVAIGMLCMIGGASDDPKVFSTDIFNFQRLTLAPILIVAGYVVVLLAILKKPKE